MHQHVADERPLKRWIVPDLPVEPVVAPSAAGCAEAAARRWMGPRGCRLSSVFLTGPVISAPPGAYLSQDG